MSSIIPVTKGILCDAFALMLKDRAKRSKKRCFLINSKIRLKIAAANLSAFSLLAKEKPYKDFSENLVFAKSG
jgi:hypothetical protein